MKNLNQQGNRNKIKVAVRDSKTSKLTKEIAAAIIEVKLMQVGTIKPLGLKDI
jgi:hypothetical protein